METLDVRASARYIPVAPQKVRLVLDIVRGMDVIDAMSTLTFTPKAAAKPVYDEFEKEAGKAWAEKVYRVVDGGYAN